MKYKIIWITICLICLTSGCLENSSSRYEVVGIQELHIKGSMFGSPEFDGYYISYIDNSSNINYLKMNMINYNRLNGDMNIKYCNDSPYLIMDINRWGTSYTLYLNPSYFNMTY